MPDDDDDNDDVDPLLGRLLRLGSLSQSNVNTIVVARIDPQNMNNSAADSSSSTVRLVDRLWTALTGFDALSPYDIDEIPVIVRREPWDTDTDATTTTTIDAVPTDTPLDSSEHNATFLSMLKEIAACLKDISPLDLHFTASQGVAYWIDDTSNNSNDTTNNRGGGGLVVVTVSFVLVCYALYQATTTMIQQRPQRWQSLIFETLRLFQRHCDSLTCVEEEENALTMWLNYILPQLCRIQQQVVAFGSSNHPPPSFPTHRRRMEHAAFLAGVIATTTKLAQDIVMRSDTWVGGTDTQQVAVRILELLLEGLEEPIDGQWDQIVLCHPWRLDSVDEGEATTTLKPGNTFQSFLTYWTHPVDDDDTDENDRNEMISYTETTWNALGLAALAAVAWDCQRRHVWSSSYLYWLWFPHVRHLLNAETRITDDQQQQQPMLSQFLGFRLLDQLIQSTPPLSVTVNPVLKWHPGSPYATFQLLSNRIVNARSGNNPAPANNNNHGPSSPELPNATETHVRMNQLLSMFTPSDQVRLVRWLVHDCPVPALQPMMLDMLRSTLLLVWSSSQHVSSSSSSSELWSYLDERLCDLERHVEGDERPVVIHADELISSCELHCAGVGLLELWGTLGNPVTPIPNIARRLKHLLVALNNSQQDWQEAGEGPDQAFLLNLLHSSITNTIGFIDQQGND